MDPVAKLHYRLRKLRNRRTGYPFASWALYGPNQHLATKLVVAVFDADEQETALKRWIVEHEIRDDPDVLAEALQLLEGDGVRRVVMLDRLLGCPHEEEIDYIGEYCPDPACRYWHGRNRWTGELQGG